MTATAFSINSHTGEIRIGDIATLMPHEKKAIIEQRISYLLDGGRSYGDNFEWLVLRGLQFGGQPASLSLCFQDDRLVQASWSVQLPDAASEDGWPTRSAIDAEIAFVRTTLAEDMRLACGPAAWGEVWSDFDAKGFLAANGLRYRSA